MLAHRKQVAEKSANNDECPYALNSSLLRLFDLPSLNLEANAYYELADFDFSSNNLKQFCCFFPFLVLSNYTVYYLCILFLC